jgi:lysozyme
MTTAANLSLLLEDLKRDEGCSLYPYLDTAEPPKTTIGFGRNLTDNGISQEEANTMLKSDMMATVDEMRIKFMGMDLGEGVERGLLNMAYNMGYPRLQRFEKMWAALKRRDFDLAAKEALNSKWSRQVGARAQRIAALIRLGE